MILVADSFMVVTASLSQAAKLAVDIQLKLFEHDWGNDELDATPAGTSRWFFDHPT